MTELTTLIEQVIAGLDEHEDRVAQAWAYHFRNDLRAFRLWWLAHQDDELVITGRNH